jgi:arylsulfatase A-like enzyme
MRRFPSLPLCILTAFLPVFSALAAEPTAARPNVLFLVLEDVSPDRFGTYGNPACKTPNIDRLAATGMRFDEFHSTPFCPSRTAMITGLRPETMKLFDNSDARLTRELFSRVTLLPEQFLNAGYETVRIGKFAHDDHQKSAWTRIVPGGTGGGDEGAARKKQGKPQEKPPLGPHADPQARFTGAPFLYGPTGLEEKDHSDHQVAGVLEELRDLIAGGWKACLPPAL